MTEVLIVDDNAQNLYLLETLLEGCGFKATKAPNGAQALALALKTPPDIIVTDILMPEMDGFELCRRCKAEKSLQHIPLIFYTATYTDLKDEQFALSLGADRFVIKPQQPEVLVQIVREVLAQPLQKKKMPPKKSPEDEKKVLQKYNEVLFRKLERKVSQLEAVIAEQKAIENRLQESEQKYRTLITQSPDGIFIVNLQGTFLAVNRIMCEKLKYTEEELLSMRIWDIVPAQYIEQHKTRIADILTGKIPDGAAEYLVRGKDGQTHYIEILSAPYQEKGELKGFQGIARDITERRKAEDHLKFINALLTTQNETSLDGILVVDEQGKMISFNRTFIDIWDIPADIAKSRSDERALNSVLDKIANQEGFIKLVNYLYEHKEEKSRDEIQMKDGRVIDRFSAPMFSAEGHYYGRVWYFRDITEHKKYEKSLIQSFQQTKKTLNDTIDTIAKIVEMKDPYTSGHQQRVASLVMAIAREMKLGDDHIDHLRMAAIIHDIGKIHVPSDILSKPGRLNDMEFGLIRTHTQGGYDIVKDMDLPCGIAQSILQHHERLDGSGYPKGLRDEEILLASKILAVADVVEAMASHRPYRPALGVTAAMEEISKNRGKLYEPDVVDACLKLFKDGIFQFKD